MGNRSFAKQQRTRRRNAVEPFDLFDYDDDTTYFKPSDASSVVNDTSPSSYAQINDLIVGNRYLYQTIKDMQPLVDADGMDFDDQTDRHLLFSDKSDLLAGNGFNFAANIKPITAGNSTIIAIADESGTSPDRAYLYITSSRYLGFKVGSTWWGYATTQLTLGAWASIEVNVVADGSTTDPLTIWINGVEQTLGAANSSAITYTSGEPAVATFGNNAPLSESADCIFNEFIFQNSNIASDSAMRISHGDYINEQRVLL